MPLRPGSWLDAYEIAPLAMELRRPRIRWSIAAIWVCAMSVALPTDAQIANAPTPEDQNVRRCGSVVSVTCSPESISAMLDLGGSDLMIVDTDRITDRSALRELASRLVLHKACVAGRLIDRSAPFKLLRVAVNALSDIEVPNAPPSNDPFGPGVYRSCDAGLQLPTVVREVRPTYTEAALHAGVQGAVWVEGLVGVRIPAHHEQPFRSKVNTDSDRC